MAEPPRDDVVSLWVWLQLWKRKDSAAIRRKAPLSHTLLDSKGFVAVANVFWSELGGIKSLVLEWTLCSWHSKVHSCHLGHSPTI